MDAQEITFNQDPEANATDMGPQETSNCCCNILCCPCKVFGWYIAPVTCQICHTLACLLFHPLNFAMATFLLTWDATMLGCGVGFIPFFCMGVPLVWLTFETIIAFSRFDLGFNYYMVQTSKNLDKSREHLLSLSLYYTNVTLCCCYNNRGENCVNLMFERMKSLFTNIEIYKYICFQILVRPLVTYATFWIIFIVAVNVGLIGLPIWYLVDDRMFVRNQVILGWAQGCEWPDNEANNGVVCSEDWFWIINTFGRALCVGIASLIAFPLVLRLNNWMAETNKIVAYKFYTFYYTKNMDTVRDKEPILASTDTYGNIQRMEAV